MPAPLKEKYQGRWAGVTIGPLPMRDRIDIRLNGYNGAPAGIFTSDSILVTRLELDKGAHTAAWNGKDVHGRPVEPGVYYVRFGDQVQKLILVK